MSKLSNFVQQVVARIKGDDAEVVALKIERKAKSAIKGQIAALESDVTNAEEKLEEAKEALDQATYPEEFSSSQEYVNDIAMAQNRVIDAEDELEAAQASLAFFTELAETKF